MRLSEDLHSVAGLMGEAVEQLAKLVQNEANLAKAELSAKLADAGRALGYILAATLFITPAIMMLFIAFAQWLVQQGFSAAGAHFSSAIVAFAVGGLLALIGVQKLKSWSLMPTVTVNEIQRDVRVAKELVR